VESEGEVDVSTEVLHLAAEEPLTLDPRKSTDDVSRFMVEQLFEGLVKVDPENNILPAVAASWEVDKGGKRYIFHLHDDLHWSDGEPLTAEDFEFAWKLNLNPATKSPTAHYLHPIKNARQFSEGEIEDPKEVKVKALDRQTLEVLLETPTAFLPQLLTHPATFPLPMHAVMKYGDDWIHSANLVSNGTYLLGECRAGEMMILRCNPYYHGNFPGNADEVKCTFFLDYDLAMEAYDSAVVDVVSMFHADPSIILRAEGRFTGELLPIPRPVTFYLVFRVDQKPIDDDRLRKALVHGLDREALVRVAFQGQRMPALGGFIPPSLPGHSSDIGLAFDVERALENLKQAGYPKGRGLPVLNLVHGPGGEDVVSFLCSSWRENLGVEINPLVVDWKTLFGAGEAEPSHMRLIGWSADYPDPDNFLRLLFHSKQGKNRPRWSHTRFDNLIEEATQIGDHARRMEMYQEADRILVAIETAVMPLTYGQGRMLIKPWISLPHASSISMRLKNFLIQRKEA
jgi:oligopeptide transport system substrate-binding protein